MINAKTIYCSGTFGSDKTVNVSVLSTNTASNINFTSPIKVNGDITTTGLVSVGKTMYITYRLATDTIMNTTEYSYIDNSFVLDETLSDITAITNTNQYIYDLQSGLFTVPMSGLYNISIQGSFKNVVPEATNGVYFYFQSETYPTCKIAPIINSSNIISTSRLIYLKSGEIIKPIFYSSDPNTTLIASKGETFVAITIVHITA